MLQILAKGLILFLMLLPLGCSNELGSTNAESAGNQAGSNQSSNPNNSNPNNSNGSEISSSTLGESGFALLDQAPVDILSDSRLQIINYWATWCLPCLEEMPELAAFRKAHLESVEVYAVNYDRLDIDQLRKEIEALEVDIPALIEDPNERLGYERPSVLPTTVIMLKGQVKEVLVGPQTMETLEAVMEKWTL